MAELEIHDAAGNVRFVALSRDRPLLIGTASHCDVVLRSPGVSSVHCRVIWRDGRWRVEVATDAPEVELKGRQVKAATIASGDCVRIGDVRLYLSEADQSAVVARPDLLDKELLGELAEEVGEPVMRRRSIRAPQRGLFGRIWHTIRQKAKQQVEADLERPPGEERLLGSRLVQVLLVVVAVIGFLGWYFYQDARERAVGELFDKAVQAKAQENWPGAIELFDRLEQSYPRHELASTARLHRALCEIQQAAETDPDRALDRTQQMIRERAGEQAFGPVVPDELGEVLRQIARNLARTAERQADRKAFELSQGFQELLKRELPNAAFRPEEQQQIDQTMEAAWAVIKRTEERTGTIAAMDAEIAQQDTFAAYRAYDRLSRLYTDLADDAEVLERVERAGTLDRQAVEYDGTTRDAQRGPRRNPIAATTLLVERIGSDAAAAAVGDVVFALTGGVCFALDAATGELLWHQVVGIASQILPLPIPGQREPRVLVVDTRHDELLALRSRTGELVWRQPVGEPLEVAPLVHRGRVYQPTGLGSLLILNPENGRIEGRLRFGSQRLPCTPVTAGRHLYLLGEQYNLYTITLGQPPRCESVYYLGHKPDSIIAAPFRMGRYLVICENETATTCRIRVLLYSTDGVTIEMEQLDLPPLNGWVHHTPSVLGGNLMFAATDMGTVSIYSAGPPEKTAGFSPVQTLSRGSGSGPRGQAYPHAYSSRDLLVAGLKVRHYNLQVEQITLPPPAEILDGAASQPVQQSPARGTPKLLFVARRVPFSTAVSFTALDAQSLENRWEVLLGSGLVSLARAGGDGPQLVALTRSGHLFAVPAAALASGGVRDRPVRQVQLQSELSLHLRPLVLSDGRTVYAAVGEAPYLIVQAASAGVPAQRIELPAQLSASPAVFRAGVLIPAGDARIYWIDPATSKMLAEPFQPPIQMDRPAVWRGVAVSAGGQILAADNHGSIYRVELEPEPVMHLRMRGDPYVMPKPIRSGIAIAGTVLACVDEENLLHTLHAESFEAMGSWKLPAPASLGPVAVGKQLFVVSGRDELVCISSQGQLAWRHALGGDAVAGVPLVQGDMVFVAMAGGRVLALRLDDGSQLWSLDAEKPLASGVVAVSRMLVVAGEDGSLNVLKVPDETRSR